jgi:Tfp pilus assembly protein PilO
MLKLKPSKRTFIALAAIGIALFMSCGFLYFNRAARLHVLQVKMQDKEKQLAESQETVKRLSEVEQECMSNQAKLGLLEKGVSTRAYVPTLLRQLEDMGKSVNLRVVGVRPKAPEPPKQVSSSSTDEEKKQAEKQKAEPYEKLYVDIEVQGKYWDVVRFIQKITSFPKIVAVRDVQIAPVAPTADNVSPRLSAKLSSTAFILKETLVQPTADKSSETKSTRS